MSGETTPPETPKNRQRRRGMLRKAIPAMIVLGALAGVVLLAAVLPERNNPKPRSGSSPVNVETVIVRAVERMADTFNLTGVVEPARVVTVSAEVAGRIERIVVQEGLDVRTGEPMIHLNKDLLQAEFDRAKAQAQFDDRERERVLLLVERGAATTNELDQAYTKAAASAAALAAAKANLDRTTILAPIDGMLDSLPMEIGEYVQPGDPVARIVDVDKVKVVVDAPESEVLFLKKGQTERVFDTGRERPVEGTITYISELADEQTRTTRVEITVDNDPRILRSGRIVLVRMTRGTLGNVIMIPLGAVIPMEDGKAVYVVDNDGKARRRNVVVDLGFIRGSAVRVTGLKPGERLIVAGHRFVSPGQPVRETILSDNAAADPTTRSTAKKRPPILLCEALRSTSAENLVKYSD